MDKPSARIIFTPSGRRGVVPCGTSVLEAARMLGVDLDSVCGGRGVCSRCQISPLFGAHPKHGLNAERQALSPWNAVEERYRRVKGLAEGRRLGCQAQILADMVVDVPPESQLHRQLVRKRADARPIALDPVLRLQYLAIPSPDMRDPLGDLERLKRALGDEGGMPDVVCELSLLQNLQSLLKKGGRTLTVALHRPKENGPVRVLHGWPGYYEGCLPGASIDIGSTTIACHLSDLRTGALLASAGMMNPQIRFGEDLMSRVSYAMMNEEGACAMTRAVRAALSQLLGEVAGEAGLSPGDILELVVVGNPVMHHLLFGIDPVALGSAPFALACGEAIEIRARALDLPVHPSARLYALPCIAGHVGADAAAVILSESPHTAQEPTLVVDVGTNAEIILGSRAGLVACSSPTGPAFEGAQISSGQRAAPGAIERVRISPETLEPRFRIIGNDAWSDEAGANLAPRGICGSGIIEAIAEMRLAGIVDADGAIVGACAERNPRIEPDGRAFRYCLYRAAGGEAICITQNDVRAIQLAKAALRAGCALLMEHLGLDKVARIALAGAFGAHISPLHAMVLGMIPDCPLDRVTAAGNAAGTGARIALLNRAARAEIEQTVRQVEKIETALAPRFQEHFIDAIAIPHKSAPTPNLSCHVTWPKPVWPDLARQERPDAPAHARRRRRRRQR